MYFSRSKRHFTTCIEVMNRARLDTCRTNVRLCFVSFTNSVRRSNATTTFSSTVWRKIRKFLRFLRVEHIFKLLPCNRRCPRNPCNWPTVYRSPGVYTTCRPAYSFWTLFLKQKTIVYLSKHTFKAYYIPPPIRRVCSSAR